MMSTVPATWHLAGRQVGPFTIGEAFQSSASHRRLKRYSEEAHDTFIIENTHHSKVGVVGGLVCWVLCGQSFSVNGIEHFGRTKTEISSLYTATDTTSEDDDYLQVLIGDVSAEMIWVNVALRWVNVTLVEVKSSML
jgi:hypothetical protein